MCGIGGFDLVGEEDTDNVSTILAAALLINIEKRGRDATGAAWWDRSGIPYYAKEGITATEWVHKNTFEKITASTSILHTRAGTTGSETDNKNNHPIHLVGKGAIPGILGVHNGIIRNHKELFTKFKYDRVGEVDSEIIFQMVRDPDQGIDKFVKEAKGDAAIAWLDLRDREHGMFMANLGRRPLEIVRTVAGSLLFASEMEAIDASIAFINKTQDLNIEVASRLTSKDTEGKMYRVMKGEIVSEREVDIIPRYTQSYQTGTYHSTPGYSSQPVYFSYGTERPRRPSYLTERCNACGKWASACVCRYSNAPLPAYPEVDPEWIKVSDHEFAPEHAVHNGETVPRGAAPNAGVWYVLGGYCVPFIVWRGWQDKVQAIDKAADDDVLINKHVVNMADVLWEGSEPRDVRYGTLLRSESGNVYLRDNTPYSGLRRVDREELVTIVEMREYRRCDYHGVYLIPLNASNSSYYPEEGDLVMYTSSREATVHRINTHGGGVAQGSWRSLYDPPAPPAQRSFDDDEEDFTPFSGGFPIKKEPELTKNQDPLAQLRAALNVTDFTLADELRHAYLVALAEETTTDSVATNLVHWKSGSTSVVCVSPEGPFACHYGEDSTTLKSIQEFPEDSPVNAYIFRVINSGRAVVEDLSEDPTDHCDDNFAWYASGEDIESTFIQRVVPLRFETDIDDLDIDSPINDIDSLTTTSQESL